MKQNSRSQEIHDLSFNNLFFLNKNRHVHDNILTHATLARLLKLPNVIKPLERAGVGHTGPASGEGV